MSIVPVVEDKRPLSGPQVRVRDGRPPPRTFISKEIYKDFFNIHIEEFGGMALSTLMAECGGSAYFGEIDQPLIRWVPFREAVAAGMREQFYRGNLAEDQPDHVLAWLQKTLKGGDLWEAAQGSVIDKFTTRMSYGLSALLKKPATLIGTSGVGAGAGIGLAMISGFSPNEFNAILFGVIGAAIGIGTAVYLDVFNPEALDQRTPETAPPQLRFIAEIDAVFGPGTFQRLRLVRGPAQGRVFDAAELYLVDPTNLPKALVRLTNKENGDRLIYSPYDLKMVWPSGIPGVTNSLAEWIAGQPILVPENGDCTFKTSTFSAMLYEVRGGDRGAEWKLVTFNVDNSTTFADIMNANGWLTSVFVAATYIVESTGIPKTVETVVTTLNSGEILFDSGKPVSAIPIASTEDVLVSVGQLAGPAPENVPAVIAVEPGAENILDAVMQWHLNEVTLHGRGHFTLPQEWDSILGGHAPFIVEATGVNLLMQTMCVLRAPIQDVVGQLRSRASPLPGGVGSLCLTLAVDEKAAGEPKVNEALVRNPDALWRVHRGTHVIYSTSGILLNERLVWPEIVFGETNLVEFVWVRMQGVAPTAYTCTILITNVADLLAEIYTRTGYQCAFVPSSYTISERNIATVTVPTLELNAYQYSSVWPEIGVLLVSELMEDQITLVLRSSRYVQNIMWRLLSVTRSSESGWHIKLDEF